MGFDRFPTRTQEANTRSDDALRRFTRAIFLLRKKELDEPKRAGQPPLIFPQVPRQGGASYRYEVTKKYAPERPDEEKKPKQKKDAAKEVKLGVCGTGEACHSDNSEDEEAQWAGGDKSAQVGNDEDERKHDGGARWGAVNQGHPVSSSYSFDNDQSGEWWWQSHRKLPGSTAALPTTKTTAQRPRTGERQRRGGAGGCAGEWWWYNQLLLVSYRTLAHGRRSTFAVAMAANT